MKTVENELEKSDVITMWLNTACGTDKSRKGYLWDIKRFFDAMKTDPETLVATWKQVKYDLRLRDEFVEEWTEKIESYAYNGTDKAPKTSLRELATVTSFFHKMKIPVEPQRKKHVFVKFHNRDITKPEIRQILEHADLRDRTFFLMMAESGLRPNTLVQLRYAHVKKDFEANKVPMMIELPSEILKDRVETRFTFCGEDAFNTLREYLKTRMPLKDDDLLFLKERRDERTEHVSTEAFSTKFAIIARKIGLVKDDGVRRPKQIRLYCLRKYFNNNIRADRSYVEYWMSHTTVQTMYVAKDIERHREEYEKGYENLRILAPDLNKQLLANLNAEVESKKKELSDLSERVKKLEPLLKLVELLGVDDESTREKFFEELKTLKSAKLVATEQS
jgi:integrase